MSEYKSETGTSGTSGMAIAGLVLGILAAVSSWMPIINNLSFVIAAVGAVFAIVGVAATVRGKKTGKGLAIAALVVNVVAIVIVLATQSAMSAAIDEATSGPSVSGVSSTDGRSEEEGADDGQDAQQASTDLAVGTTVSLANGLTVTVDSVDTSLFNYDGSAIVGAHVTYANNGDESASYNTYDWKGEDADGAQEYGTYFSDATDELGSGTLAAGGSKSGNVYFEGSTVKILYFGSILTDEPTASWNIG